MTGIEWTDLTENPIYLRSPDGRMAGHWCAKKSAGCLNCYAETINLSNRFDFASGLPYSGSAPDNLIFDPSFSAKWANARKPKRRFICSMTDVFGEWVPREWQFALLDDAAKAPSQVIQLLTKRPAIALIVLREWRETRKSDALSNVWIGASIEDSSALEARRAALKILRRNGWRTFYSVEPLLERIELDLNEYPVDWLIVGGESGLGARMSSVLWIKSIVDQCKASRIPVFVKQLGSNVIDLPLYCGNNGRGKGKMAKPHEWPAYLQYRQHPAYGISELDARLG